eukprot:PhF_6_TR602/c2_g1_i1/m.720
MIYLPHDCPELVQAEPLLPELLVMASNGHDMSCLQAHAEKVIMDNVQNSSKSWLQRRSGRYCSSAMAVAQNHVSQNINYIQQGTTAVPYDTQTGSEMLNTRWQDGLDQMVCINHGLPLAKESLHAVYMSIPDWVSHYDGNVTAVTGTCGGRAYKTIYKSVYQLDSIVIPPSRPRRMIMEPFACLPNREEWKDYIINLACDKQRQGHPVLIVTATPADVEDLYTLSRGRGVPVDLYYRNTDTLPSLKTSARIILCTAKGGRGTDIKLPESMVEKGLYVIFTYIGPTRERRQALARAGRQGQVGAGKIVCYPPSHLRLDDEQQLRRWYFQETSSVMADDNRLPSAVLAQRPRQRFEEILKTEFHRDVIQKISTDETWLTKELQGLAYARFAQWIDDKTKALENVAMTGCTSLRKEFNEFKNQFSLTKEDDIPPWIDTPPQLLRLLLAGKENEKVMLRSNIWKKIQQRAIDSVDDIQDDKKDDFDVTVSNEWYISVNIIMLNAYFVLLEVELHGDRHQLLMLLRKRLQNAVRLLKVWQAKVRGMKDKCCEVSTQSCRLSNLDIQLDHRLQIISVHIDAVQQLVGTNKFSEGMFVTDCVSPEKSLSIFRNLLESGYIEGGDVVDDVDNPSQIQELCDVEKLKSYLASIKSTAGRKVLLNEMPCEESRTKEHLSNYLNDFAQRHEWQPVDIILAQSTHQSSKCTSSHAWKQFRHVCESSHLERKKYWQFANAEEYTGRKVTKAESQYDEDAVVVYSGYRVGRGSEDEIMELRRWLKADETEEYLCAELVLSKCEMQSMLFERLVSQGVISAYCPSEKLLKEWDEDIVKTEKREKKSLWKKFWDTLGFENETETTLAYHVQYLLTKSVGVLRYGYLSGNIKVDFLTYDELLKDTNSGVNVHVPPSALKYFEEFGMDRFLSVGKGTDYFVLIVVGLITAALLIAAIVLLATGFGAFFADPLFGAAMTGMITLFMAIKYGFFSWSTFVGEMLSSLFSFAFSAIWRVLRKIRWIQKVLAWFSKMRLGAARKLNAFSRYAKMVSLFSTISKKCSKYEARTSEMFTMVRKYSYEAGKKLTKPEIDIWYANDVKLAFSQIVNETLNKSIREPLNRILDRYGSQVCDVVLTTLESELKRSLCSFCKNFLVKLILDQALKHARDTGTMISWQTLVDKCSPIKSILKTKSAKVIEKVMIAIDQPQVERSTDNEALMEEAKCVIQLLINNLGDEALQAACSRESEFCSQVMAHISNPKKVSKKNNGASRAEMKPSSCKSNWKHLVATGLQRRMICEGLAAEDLPSLATIDGKRPCNDLNLWVIKHQGFLIFYSCMENSSPGVLEKIRNSD